jgi:hypothetical protein
MTTISVRWRWRLPHISFLCQESGENCCAGLDEELSTPAKQRLIVVKDDILAVQGWMRS